MTYFRSRVSSWLACATLALAAAACGGNATNSDSGSPQDATGNDANGMTDLDSATGNDATPGDDAAMGNDVATGSDVVTGNDVVTGTDVVNTTDVVNGTDVQNIPDTSTADTGTPIDSGPADCGANGQACCAGDVCNSGLVCDSSVGQCAPAQVCQTNSDCPGSLACVGPADCGGTLCFHCMPSPGAGNLGDRCSTGADCITGVCDPFRLECSLPCRYNSPVGDSDCSSGAGAGTCTVQQTTVGSVTQDVGYCGQSCLANADCVLDGRVCIAVANAPHDRVDTVCGYPRSGTSGFGESCGGPNDCGTGVCGGSPGCTQLCHIDQDCDFPLPSCQSVTFTNPGGTMQTLDICSP